MMNRTMNCARVICLYVSICLMTISAMGQDLFEEAPWTLSGGLGKIFFEGDEEVEDGEFAFLKLGYDFNPRWTIEYDLSYMPVLNNREFPNEPERFALTDDTWAIRLAGDLLFHLRKSVDDLHWDPYLSGGIGLIHFGDAVDSGQDEVFVTAGGGLFYHFNDEWAIRSDARWIIAGADTEVNVMVTAGINWRWGADVPASYSVSGGEIDSDQDGLPDSHEADIGTDPFDPDTDDDGLTDGQEVLEYNTNPLNPDTDLDALKDGAEVFTYQTDPLDRDTDEGGVADGHEVIEDYTDPLDPSDDLKLYTLNIEFDYNKSHIRSKDYDELDIIVKVLTRDPEATARVEGHADKRKKSSRKYNLKLSKRRAKAIVGYLIDVGGIDASRLTYEGYGFDRPLAPNDTEENMQKNRRTEIYIRPGNQNSTDQE